MQHWIDIKVGALLWWREASFPRAISQFWNSWMDRSAAAGTAPSSAQTIREARALSVGARDLAHGWLTVALAMRMHGSLPLLIASKVFLPNVLPNAFLEAPRRAAIAFARGVDVRASARTILDAPHALEFNGRPPVSPGEILAAAWDVPEDHPLVAVAHRVNASRGGARGREARFSWDAPAHAPSTEELTNHSVVWSLQDADVVRIARAVAPTGVGWREETRALPDTPPSAASSFAWGAGDASSAGPSRASMGAAPDPSRFQQGSAMFRHATDARGKAPAVSTFHLSTLLAAYDAEPTKPRFDALRTELMDVLARIQDDDELLRREALSLRGLFATLPVPPAYAVPEWVSNAATARSSFGERTAMRWGLPLMWPKSDIAPSLLSSTKFADLPHVTGPRASAAGVSFNVAANSRALPALAELAAVADQRLATRFLSALRRDDNVSAEDALNALGAWLRASRHLPVAMLYLALA